MKKLFTSLFIMVYAAEIISAQQKYPVQNDVITGLFSKLAESNNDDEREKTNESIRSFVREYAASDSVFKFTYDARYLGQITSPDSLLKIITWNLMLESGKNRYFCFLVRKTAAGDKVNELSAQFGEKPPMTDTTYKASDWYGALYYDMRPFRHEGDTCWAVLGFDYGDSDISRKVIDIVSFDKNGPPVFGKKCFKTPEGIKYRQVFEYASMGSMSLRFTSDSTIIFDHLVPISKASGTAKVYHGADYSYDSFVLSGEEWLFRLNVDVRNQE